MIDLQGCQSASSRDRGIGRYSLSFAKALARNATSEEIFFALNDALPHSVAPIKRALEGLVPKENLKVFSGLAASAELNDANLWRRNATKIIATEFFRSIQADIVHISSLFEGLGDDVVTDLGQCESFQNSVTLYDLIPLVYNDVYLSDPRTRKWYLNRISELKSVSLCLSISDHSRREAIDLLGLDSERVCNVGAAAEPIFRPVVLDHDTETAFRAKYNLNQRYIMYTGGIEHRKNLERLIRAFCSLPAVILCEYQLVIVCSITNEQRELFSKIAELRGGSANVLFTGFVPEEDLVILYNLCTLFVFPSLREGFGLPVLEAMMCGAPVIGSDSSSIREIIGRQDALFDPNSVEAIASKMLSVVSDTAYLEELRVHGQTQAKKFNWDIVAKRALDAMRKLGSGRAVHASTRHLRLAMVSPFPPEQSGIADYSAKLLPALGEHYDITIITEADAQPDCKHQIASCSWFDENAASFDRILYHFGNSKYHLQMLGLLRRHPGVVLLHDFYLSGLVSYSAHMNRSPGEFYRVLAVEHGYSAVGELLDCRDVQRIAWKYPCSYEVMRDALGVIVHSKHAVELAQQWYGNSLQDKIRVIPFGTPYFSAPDKRAAREELQIPQERFVGCSFGMVAPTKLSHRIVEAWGRAFSNDALSTLFLVGDHPSTEYGERIAAARISARAYLTGHVGRREYELYLAAADVAIQLRSLSRGETSAAIFDCLAAGTPVIANAHGSSAEIPADCLHFLPDQFEDADLDQALRDFRCTPRLAAQLAERALHYVRSRHAPECTAQQYRSAIEEFSTSGAEAHRLNTVRRVAKISCEPAQATKQDFLVSARAIATTFPARNPARMLIDVSGYQDGRSGLLRSLIVGLLRQNRGDRRVVPVHLTEKGFCEAHNLAFELLGIPERIEEEVIDFTSGDVFIELAPTAELNKVPGYVKFRECGGTTYFLVCTVPDTTADPFTNGLLALAADADGAICPSVHTASSFCDWLDGAQPNRVEPLKLGVFQAPVGWSHRLNDVKTLTSAAVKSYMTVFSEVTTVLVENALLSGSDLEKVVGAFDRLWSRNVDVCLLIIGKSDDSDAASRIRHHAEWENHLVWFDHITDDLLDYVCENLDGYLDPAEHFPDCGAIHRAVQFGVPILIHDTPGFRELCGDNASYFQDYATLSGALSDWVNDIKNCRAPSSWLIRLTSAGEAAKSLLDSIGSPTAERTWEPGQRWYYTAKSGRIFNEVGNRVAGCFQTDGRLGYLVFGPYCSVPAGRYLVTLDGWLVIGGGATVGIAADRGEAILAEFSSLEATKGFSPGCIFSQEFAVLRSCNDLEIRVRVTKDSVLGVSAMELRPAPYPRVQPDPAHLGCGEATLMDQLSRC